MDEIGEMYDFLDGAGPVPAHRHINPDGTIGGWVANTAYVAPTAFVEHEARVFGNAWVQEFADISGQARVSGNAWVLQFASVGESEEVR